MDPFLAALATSIESSPWALPAPAFASVASVIGTHSIESFEELLEIIEAVPVVGKYKLTMIDRFGAKRFYTLNNENRSRLINVIEQATFGPVSYEVHGSDADFIIEGDQYLLNKIVIEEITKTVIHESTEGGFFPFYNKTYLDLSPLGIFTREQHAKAVNSDYYDENCFINSLRCFNIPEEELNYLKYRFRNGTISATRHFGEIADHLGVKFSIAKRSKDGSIKNLYYPKSCKERRPVIQLVHMFDHYMPNIKITSPYAIKNRYVKHCKVRSPNVNTHSLMKRLESEMEDAFEPIVFSRDMMRTTLHDKVKNKKDYETIDYPVQDSKEWKKSPYEPKDQLIMYADSESYTAREGEKVEAFMICVSYYIKSREEWRHLTFMSSASNTASRRFVNFLHGFNRDITCYFHNLQFDFSLIKEDLNIEKILKAGGKPLIVTCRKPMKGKERVIITFKDSWRMINHPLRKFPKMFGLKSEKEVMPYNWYTKENWLKYGDPYHECINIKDAIEHVKEEDRDHFRKVCSDMFGEDKFHPFKYSEYYCRRDVEVLSKGFETFRGWFLEEFDVDVHNYHTSPAVAKKIQEDHGCFIGSYALRGIPHDFIRECVVGGRTMVKSNGIFKCELELDDLDANSLYPSAMAEMPGYLLGLPNPMEIGDPELSMEFLSNVSYYFVEIDVLDIPIKRDFPLLSKKNEDGVRIFSNDIRGRVYVDKVALEDAVKYQGLVFRLLRGYYYNSGFNNEICNLAVYLREQREKLKKKGNPAEQCYKLVMNAGYGKLIEKYHPDDILIKNNDELDTYIWNNYNTIVYYEAVNDRQNLVKVKKQIADHFAYPHNGSMILSYSKRIMNRVMCLAEDLGITIMYQDTDSMHIQKSRITKLESEYNRLYSKSFPLLLSSGLGGFECDFDFKCEHKDCVNHKGECQNVSSVKSIFLGKKMYIDYLRCSVSGKTGHHMRMKGVPSTVLKPEDYENLFGSLSSTEESFKYDDLSRLFEFDRNLSSKGGIGYSRTATIKGKRTLIRVATP